MQLEAARQANVRERLTDAYDRLGVWLYNLERTIDEVWFGYYGEDASVVRRARDLLENWYPETLRVPLEACSAQFYWSTEVREEIRKFEGLSFNFVAYATAAISNKQTNESEALIQEAGSEMRQSRRELLAALDRIRDYVRLDLDY
jgi:hypothetical protein